MKILNVLGWVITCTSGFAVMIILGVMASDVGLSNVFTWHPILLSLAFLMFMNEGLLVYFNGKLEQTDRSISRYWHARYMFVASMLAIGGYICIYISHAKTNHSQFGIGHHFINALHVWIGYLVLVLMLLQTLVGMSKYFEMVKAKFHGKLGLYIYVGGICNICIASIFWNSESWKGIVPVLIIVLSLSLCTMTFLIKHNGGILISDNIVDNSDSNEYETVSLNDESIEE